MTDTNALLAELIRQQARTNELLEALVRQNAPPPELLEKEFVGKMKAALASGDRAAMKAVNRQYHAHRGVKI